MEEIWKPINGFEGLYSVSNQGRVRSEERSVRNGWGYKTIPSKTMKLYKNKRGYLFAYLFNGDTRKRARVHRLVAEAFIENPNSYDQVNHIDGDKTNNASSNLEWCDQLANMAHASNHGLFNPRKTKVMRNDGVVFTSISEAAKAMGCSVSLISGCICGKWEHAQGYTFERICDD